jgi:hypothetical protein
MRWCAAWVGPRTRPSDRPIPTQARPRGQMACYDEALSGGPFGTRFAGSRGLSVDASVQVFD